jgi:hypothetical protein
MCLPHEYANKLIIPSCMHFISLSPCKKSGILVGVRAGCQVGGQAVHPPKWQDLVFVLLFFTFLFVSVLDCADLEDYYLKHQESLQCLPDIFHGMLSAQRRRLLMPFRLRSLVLKLFIN